MPEDRSVLTRVAPAPDAVAAYGPGPQQVVELRSGGTDAARRPLVIIIHGGFWRPQFDRTHAGPMAAAIAAVGWSTALPEYSRVPGDPDATLADLARIVTQSNAWPVPNNQRVVLIGHSAGGHLVLWASSAGICPALTGTLALAPVADLVMAYQLGLGDNAVFEFLGAEPARRPQLDPRQMSQSGTDITIIHGLDDLIVPIALSESYRSAHSVTQVIPLAGAGHFALIDPQSAAWASVLRAIEKWVA